MSWFTGLIAKVLGQSRPSLFIDKDGWLHGPGVTRIPSHPSWFGGTLATGLPQGITAHVTDTGPGTAVAMAKRRAKAFVKGKDRLSSWHGTIETDGMIVQMIPFKRVAWHAGSSTAKPIPGLGWANYTTNGIELVGRIKGPFLEPQVAAAERLWRVLVEWAGIEREHAMIEHSALDPARRSDPGPEWMEKHAERVLDYAYGATG